VLETFRGYRLAGVVLHYAGQKASKMTANKVSSDMTLRNNTLCIRAKVRGIQDADDLESFECVYFRIQGTGADPAVQGNREAG
jgi:hypothetical protein